jgi:hypothetical protein
MIKQRDKQLFKKKSILTTELFKILFPQFKVCWQLVYIFLVDVLS